jgi:hypothetical protein
MKVMTKSLMALYFFSLHHELFAKDRRPSYPFITGDGFRALAEHILDEDVCSINLSSFKKGDIVFVKTEFLDRFIGEFLPKIPLPFILITHNSDCDIPGRWSFLLDEPKLLAWFGQNVMDASHPKLHPLPIGITNRYNFNGEASVYFSALKKAQMRQKYPKQVLAYWNMNIETSFAERKKSYEHFSNMSACLTLHHLVPFKNYVRNLLKSHFIVSPRGNGLDCHRSWEALYFGAIPIVKHSGIDSLFEGLPVLIIEDWSQVSEELLIQTLSTLEPSIFLEKLWFPYWKNLIHSYKATCDL